MKYTIETLKNAAPYDIDMFMDMFIGYGECLDYYKSRPHKCGRFVSEPDLIMPIAIENNISYEVVQIGELGIGYKAKALMSDGSHNHTTATCDYPYQAIATCALMMSLTDGLLVKGDRLLNSGVFK